jgi:ATP-binding cassette subfamily B protein
MQIIADLLTIVVVVIFMFIVNWRLSLVTLSTFPLLIFATYVFKEKIKSAFSDVRTQVARLNAFLQERISGMRVVQIFNAEDSEMKKFESINTEHKKANIRSVWYYSVFFPVVEIITALAIALMVWYGSTNIVSGHTTIGHITAFLLFLNMLFRPLRMLADKFNTLQMGIVAADRIFGTLDTHEVIENKGRQTADAIQGGISFEKMWFAYNEEDYVLKNVEFNVPPGKTLAIVGATGAGKTSIINILTRYYEINKGCIKIDDTPIQDYELSSLRKNIGMVLQDVFLFSGSIMENITLRNKDITEAQAIEASKIVGAHNFIMKLPGKYDYNVMERGATLSMGQRQLISFIRALVFNPRILILDEATSSIDTESEILIQRAIETLIADRTSIVIAHRLSTIQNADQILVLDHGEVVEKGTHEELLELGGQYRKLHDMQFSKEAPLVGEQAV